MNKLYLGLITALLFTITSCEKDKTDNPVNNPTTSNEEPLYLVGNVSTNSGNYTVQLFSDDTIFVGYNKIYVEVKNSSNQPVTNATIVFNPIMHMTSMTHSSPIENPSLSVNADNRYEGAIVFSMPSNTTEYWTLDVIASISGVADTAHFTIPKVKSPSETRKINVTSAIDGTIYLISLLQPKKCIVGENDIEFTVHKKVSMMSFPAVEDIMIEIEPEMPSMGHGSPNNVNPIHIENGHYKGKVNFTMTGWWKVNLLLKKGNDTITSSAYFDVTFQ